MEELKYELMGIKMSFEEFDHLLCEQASGKDLKIENGKVIAVEHIPTQEEITNNRITELKQNLANTDYIANKLAEAIADSLVTGDNAKVYELKTKYAKQLQDRKSWRDEIDRLEKN